MPLMRITRIDAKPQTRPPRSGPSQWLMAGMLCGTIGAGHLVSAPPEPAPRPDTHPRGAEHAPAATAAGQQLPSTPAGPGVPTLVISSAVPDAAAGTLTISGANFGARPLVTLDLVPVTLQSATDSRVVASVPVGMMPAARYLLTVSRGGAAGESASLRLQLGGPGAAEHAQTPAASPSAPPGPADAGAPQTSPAGTLADAATTATGATSAARAEPIPAGTTAAARVGDTVITIDEVDREWQRTDPAGYLAASRGLYEARRRIVHELVTNELLRREAETRGLTIDALLEAELPKRTVSMPDSAVTSLFLALGERARGATIDQMRPALRAWLEQITEPELAKMSYTEELMKVSTRADILLGAPTVRVERAAQDASLGPATAPVELVAFGDFQSVDYARFAQVFGRIRETFGDRLRLVFKHLPVQGPISVSAAEAAHCANLQGKFWPFHDAVLARPAFLDTARLKQFASEAGLDRATFDVCVDRDEARSVIARAADEAARYDVRTTPSVLVNGVLAPAPPPFLPPFEYFQRLIEEELLRQSKARTGR